LRSKSIRQVNGRGAKGKDYGKKVKYNHLDEFLEDKRWRRIREGPSTSEKKGSGVGKKKGEMARNSSQHNNF